MRKKEELKDILNPKEKEIDNKKNILPEVQSMLNSIKREEEAIARGEDTTKFYSQPDYDLGEVLEHCFGGKINKHKIRYDDGTERELTDDDWKI